MKRILNIKQSFALMLVIVMGLGITSCVDNNEDAPPVKVFVPGSFITIAEAKKYYDEELAKTEYKTRVPVEIIDNVSIKGIITTDDNLNGNLYKEAYIQDLSGGLLMKLNTTGALNMGDSVIVNLKGLFIGDYGNFVQLGTTPYTDDKGNLRVNNIDVDECMSRFSFLNPTTPTVVTISGLKTNLDKYLGCLVKLEDVQFADSELGKKYAVVAKDGEDAEYGNRNLEDCFKNKIVVRSSGYSTFADEFLPEGKGSIVGIVTKYTSTIQLIIRDINEVKLDGERCSGDIGGTPSGSGTKEDPYNIAWLLAGNQPSEAVWVKGYIVGSATGAAFDSGLSFEAPFTGASNVALAASPDDKEPALIIPVQLVANTEIRTAINLVDNPGNVKREVLIKGLAQTYFGKPGIKSPSGYWWTDTNTGIDPDDQGTVEPGEGDGTRANPFDIAWLLAGNQLSEAVWVKGYIVGSASGAAFDSGLSFDAPFTGASNVALAASPDEKNPALIIPVQLVANTAIRTAINLVDNPGNVKREVLIKGLAQTYFGKPGIKSPSGYWWTDTNTGIDPDGGTGEPVTIFSETFEAGIGNFKAISVKGDQGWYHDASYKYMKMSGNQNQVNYENEDWLVSPQISLSGISNAKLTFDHTGKVFGAPFTDMTVWVSTNFDGNDVATANWTQVTIPTYMSGNDWNFVNSGEMSLSAFNNEAKIFIAFKYTSTNDLAATWEIKNVNVKK